MHSNEIVSRQELNNKANKFDQMCQDYSKLSIAIENMLSACPSVKESSYQDKWEDIRSEMIVQLNLIQKNLKNSDNIRQGFGQLREQVNLMESLLSSNEIDSGAIEGELSKIREIYSKIENSFKDLSNLSEESFRNCNTKFQNLMQDIGTVEIKEMVKELDENKKEQKALSELKEKNEIEMKLAENNENQFKKSILDLSEQRENLKKEKISTNSELIKLQNKKDSEKENYEKTKVELTSKMRNDFISSRENTKKGIINRFNEKKSSMQKEHVRLRQLYNVDLRAKFSANSSLWGKNPYEDAFNQAFADYCKVDKELQTVDQILNRDLIEFDNSFDLKKSESENRIKTEISNIKLPQNYEQELKILNNQLDETNNKLEINEKENMDKNDKLSNFSNLKLRYTLETKNYLEKIEILKKREKEILKIFENQGHNSPLTAYAYFQSIMDFCTSIQSSTSSLGSIDNFSQLIQSILNNSFSQIHKIFNSYEIDNVEKMSMYNKVLSYVINYSKEAYQKTVEVTSLKFKILMNSEGAARKANIKKLFSEDQVNKLDQEELDDLENEINTKYDEVSSQIARSKKKEIILKNKENIELILNNLKNNLILK